MSVEYYFDGEKIEYYFDGEKMDVGKNDFRSYGLGDLSREDLMKEVLDCEGFLRDKQKRIEELDLTKNYSFIRGINEIKKTLDKSLTDKDVEYCKNHLFIIINKVFGGEDNFEYYKRQEGVQ